MQIDLRIAIWNANGLSSHQKEVELFLLQNFIDILLISETHFTSRSSLNFRNYNIISANHPNNVARGGAAIIIKSCIPFKEVKLIERPFLQAACISIKCSNVDVAICALYFPPRFNLKCNDFCDFFSVLGTRFLAAGDFNAKHTWWGSRLINPKGRELIKAIQQLRLSVLSTGSPTYWPTDPSKIPDLIDFAIFSGILDQALSIEENFDLNSDHSALVISFNTMVRLHCPCEKLMDSTVDVASFKYWISKELNLDLPMHDQQEIDEALEKFVTSIHEASFLSRKSSRINRPLPNFSIEIRRKLKEKRKLRKIWQRTRCPSDKSNLNRAAKLLQEAIKTFKNESIKNFLESIGYSSSQEYQLWRATKYLKRPVQRNNPIKSINGEWCRSDDVKAHAFASYLENVFQPNENSLSRYEEQLEQYLDVACQMDLPIRSISQMEVENEIKRLNSKKAPGYDMIDAKTVKALPESGINFLVKLFNNILHHHYFPSQWKLAKIIMIVKPNKPPFEVTSYRPISLLPIFSKIFERLFLQRLLPVLEDQNLIPEHQFGFRQSHSAPQQCHRVVKNIVSTLEEKKYCSAVFLDVEKAFDKVWHIGLLYKMKKLLPTPFYLVLKQYLNNRMFFIQVKSYFSSIRIIKSGVPQGSVLGPILYSLYTADIPTTDNVMLATYADDTAVMATDDSATTASSLLQRQLNLITVWLEKWKIKVNAEKSNHITFTLRRETCPNVSLNGRIINTVESVRYLGLHLDRRLTWKHHIKTKHTELKIKTRKMFWLLNPRSQLDLKNKVLLYKTILKPVWTYGIQLWGTASHSNIEILQRYQSKTLRMISNSPWYVANKVIHADLNIPFVKDEIKKYSEKYLHCLEYHPNVLAICLLDETDDVRRLKRYHFTDLPFRA